MITLWGCGQVQESRVKSPPATKPATQNRNEVWWKETVVYQIYPRGFKDGNGDGVGGLRGIISRLDYLKSLGVETIWLNPIYALPNDDNGYDLSDYRRIQSELGTMRDFGKLLRDLHQRGLKLVMDLVVNHGSDEHERRDISRFVVRAAWLSFNDATRYVAYIHYSSTLKANAPRLAVAALARRGGPIPRPRRAGPIR